LVLAAVTQTIYVLEVVQSPLAYAGVQQPQTDVCVLKAVEVVLLIVQLEHQCGAVSKLVVSAERAHSMPTVVLFVITVAVLPAVVLMRLVEM
jgi:hypothetical protein